MNGKKQPKIPYKFSSKFIFSDTLPRIIRVIEDEKKFDDIIMSTDLPYVFSDNETPMKFTYHLNQASFYNSYAEASLLIINEKIQTPINLVFNFSENTLENTVLAVVEIGFVKRELIPLKYTNKIINLFPKISANIISSIDKILQDDKKDIYHYQSKIFNYSIEKIFNILLCIPKILLEKGIFSSCNIDNGEEIKEGVTLTLVSAEDQKEVKIKVNKIKNDESEKKWMIEFLPLDGEVKEEKVQFKLIKIEKDKTLVCQINKFLEHIESDINDQLTLKKTQAFNFIQEELKQRYDN